jgi:GT2 family glycosyltransferase
MIDRAGNFDENVHPTDDPRNHFGEDIEWGWRLVRSGARAVFAPEALVLHAVEASTRSRALRRQLRLRNVPWLVRTVPEARRHYIGGYFISRHHVLVAVTAGCLVSAGIAALAGRRRTALGMAALGMGGYLSPWRPVLADIADRAAFDAVQLAALLYGSLKWRRVVL